MIRAFIKDGVIYSFPAFFSRGLSLFLIPLYTRVLSPADYGSFDLLMVFSSFVSLVVALEVSQGVARFYAAEKEPLRKVGYASSALWFTLVCYSVFSLAMLFFSAPLSALVMGREDMVIEFQVGILYIFLNAIFSLLQNQFRWELRSKNFAVASVLFSVSSAVAVVVLAYCLRMGLLGLLLGMVLGALLAVLYGFWNLRDSYKLYFDRGCLADMLVFSVPLVPSSLAVVSTIYMDRIMISHFMAIDDVGIFGVGARLASAVGLLLVGFQGALTPLVYTYYREAETPGHLADIFRYFSVFSLLVCASVSMFARDILSLITTPEYYSAASVVIFLAPAALLAQMYIFSPGIGIAKKTHIMIWANMGGLLLSASLNWLLIPVFGIEGAAFSTCLSHFLVFGIIMAFSQRYYFVPHAWLRISVSCMLCCALVAFALQLELVVWGRWLANVMILCFMFVLFVWLGMIRIDEICQARNVLVSCLHFARANR